MSDGLLNRMMQGLAGMLAGLVLTACGGGASDAGGAGAGRLIVATGEELRVAAGTVLTGESGIDVLGRILVEPGDGGLSLIAESGDIRLEGSIVVLPSEPGATSMVAQRHRAMAAGTQRSTASAAASPGVHGGGVVIEARAGNIVVGAAHFVITGDGGSAASVSLRELAATSAVEVEYRAPAGGDGGDILLSAPRGAVVFRPRGASDPPPFHLGNGGAGADLAVAADLRVASEKVFFVAGAGGESGRFDINALRVEGAAGVARFFAQGRGGDGGNATWTPSASPALPAAAEYIALRGGDGGQGTRAGGRGGDAQLDGQGALRDPEVTGSVRQTMFAAIGGAGGATDDAAPLLTGAQDDFQGGRGGDAHAAGHSGWAGSAATAGRGGNGGRANAFGGNGGAVQATANARGGRGGDASAVSGSGGDGEDRCAVGAGGQGGDAGLLQARGGNGGDVIALVGGGALAGAGGDGGNVTRAELGAPGRGGRGEPAGDAGAEGVVIALYGGDGGKGAELGFLGTVPEVVFGIAPLTDACDAEPRAPSEACLPPGRYRYDVTLSIEWNDSHTVDAPRGLRDRQESYTVGQRVTLSGSGESGHGATGVTANGSVDGTHTVTIAGSDITTTWQGSGDGIEPTLTIGYNRGPCTWAIHADGGRVPVKRRFGDNEFDAWSAFPSVSVGNASRGEGVAASGSMSIPLSCRSGSFERTDCEGRAAVWIPGSVPLTPEERDSKTISFIWSITASPLAP